MKYETNDAALKSDEGARLYKIICEEFDRALEHQPALKERIHNVPSYLGSHTWVAQIVRRILNKEDV